MFFDVLEQGIVVRVRLSPNSSSCSIKGVFRDALGSEFLKISVVSVPEKGKANMELQNFLAKLLKISKNKIEIVAGQTDKYKKIFIHDKSEILIACLEKWNLENS